MLQLEGVGPGRRPGLVFVRCRCCGRENFFLVEELGAQDDVQGPILFKCITDSVLVDSGGRLCCKLQIYRVRWTDCCGMEIASWKLRRDCSNLAQDDVQGSFESFLRVLDGGDSGLGFWMADAVEMAMGFRNESSRGNFVIGPGSCFGLKWPSTM